MTYRYAAGMHEAPPAMPDLAAMIRTSHRRSEQFGLAPGARPDFTPLAGADLSSLIERNRVLYNHALPAMETLYQQIADTHNMVLLTDAQGVILHALGDADFLEKANRVALTPGVAWSEARRGTNAIGTAIAEGMPATVHADQHFLASNHFLTCSATPIADHHGNVVGVLDVSGDRRSFHKHTMALVRMSALMVENQLFAAAFGNAITLHFHTRPEFIGTLMEGIASFTPGGRFLAANRNGLFQLGLSSPELQAHTFHSLFGLPVSALYEHYRTAAPGLLDLCMHSGVRVRGRAELRLTNGAQVLTGTPTEAPLPPPRPAAAPLPASHRAGLRSLDTGDARLAHIVDKVGKVLGHGVSILILGETGTGKELLARAIHADGHRSRAPFVAVNCASIPETLIESELFGYEDGAFTGARRKGATGKILQADGGTLFLDEIGDMPASLQARLLRVLQERVVMPLGSAKSLPVDIDVICATNRDLRQRIAEGHFREDLYYRLNGLVVKLPPLRERTDLATVARNILATTDTTGGCRLSHEVLHLFRRHRWPGNLRQLANLLRTAAIMAGAHTHADAEIHPHHLPDDFLDDLADVSTATAPASTLVAYARAGACMDARAAAPAVNGTRLEAVELATIRATLAAYGGNVAAAARALGISRNTLYRKLPQLG